MLDTKHADETGGGDAESMTRRQLFLRLGKGLAAGAAGGVVGSGVKLVCEVIAPPRAPGREPPPGILVSNLLQARRGYGLDAQGKKKAGLAVHWTFGTLTSAAYGALAEFFPVVTAGYGTAYGEAVWLASHESALPLLHLTPPLNKVPASEQINEFISHGIFGASVEATRRFVRRLL